MASELRIYLPDPQAPADARRALKILEGVLDILDKLDTGHGAEREGRITWRFAELAIGSVDAAVVLEKPRHGQSDGEAEALLPRLVEGLAVAEERPIVPPGWNVEAAKKARTVMAKDLGDERVQLQVRGDRATAMRTITRRAGSNLDAALQSTMETLGSLTGRIESVNFHDGKREARLWLEAPRRAVVVHFSEAQTDDVKEALRRRVQARGLISRDRGRRATSMRLQSIRVMREANPAGLAALAGAFPDFTGGVQVDEYLEELRGAS